MKLFKTRILIILLGFLSIQMLFSKEYNTYYGFIQNPEIKISDIQLELKKVDAHLAVKMDNLLIIKSKMDISVELNDLNITLFSQSQINTLDNYNFNNSSLAKKIVFFKENSVQLGNKNFRIENEHICTSGCSCIDTYTTEVKLPIKLQDEILNIDPNITSDIMVGTSTVAVFFVQNILHQNMGVPGWDNEKQTDAIANIVINLEWWTDLALSFGKEKSFELVTYTYNNPISQIDFDPTEGYTGLSDQDYKFQEPIMAKLGYTEGNRIVRMRQFSHDLRIEKGTDWAFCAFILEGEHPVRAHASINGPATVLTRLSTTIGYTFTHELGHIYGAVDEYWEAAYALGRAARERFGVPNGNFHWRNFPVQPSMMAASFSGGISYYTAVHLGLADTVRYTKIITEPQNAIYEVIYYDAQDRPTTPTRYQGEVDFHWGAGMKITLRALEIAVYDENVWKNPRWNNTPQEEYTFIVDDELANTINLTYEYTTKKAYNEWKYLNVNNALASPDIYTINVSDNLMGFGGTRGISVWDGENREILDYRIHYDQDRFVDLPKESRASFVTIDEKYIFATSEGEIITWQNNEQVQLTSDNSSLAFTSVTSTTDNIIWAAVGATGRDGSDVASPMGLHKFDGEQYSIMLRNNSSIPSNNVSAVQLSYDGNLWVSFLGATEEQSGLYLYDTKNDKWYDYSNQISGKYVRKLAYNELDVLMAITDKGVSLIQQDAIINLQFEMKENVVIFDMTMTLEGEFIYATNKGLMVYKNDEYQYSFDMDNSFIPSNFAYAVSINKDQDIVVGTNDGVAIAKILIPVGVSVEHTENGFIHYGCHPNPLVERANIVFYNEIAGEVELSIYDILGNEIFNQAQYFNSGLNNFNINAKDLNISNSMYIYNLKFGNSKLSGKIIKGS